METQQELKQEHHVFHTTLCLDYAAPEVWADQPYSFPADMWSLGCVIYEMTALKPPFRFEYFKIN